MKLTADTNKRARIISGHASLSEAQAFMDEVDLLRAALERIEREGHPDCLCGSIAHRTLKQAVPTEGDTE